MAAPMDGSCDADFTKINQDMCEIEATVTSGFENIAKGEAEEKLNVKSEAYHGHITYTIPIDEAYKSMGLTTLENLYVIMQHHHNFQFKDNKTDALKQLCDLVPGLDWGLGLKVWQRFSDYPHKVSPLPQPAQPASQDMPTTENNSNRVNTYHTSVYPEDHANDYSSVAKNSDNCDSRINVNASNVESDVVPASDSCEEPKTKVRRTCHGFPDLPSFRVTCYRSNGKHSFSSMEAASQFGSRVQDQFGWNVSMKDFDIEVVLFISGSHVYIGIALTKESLHRRHISHFGPTPLKPTIACGMLRLCDIQPGELVCDPMCGGGTIPIQAATYWPEAEHLCGELHDMAVSRSQMNIEAVNAKREHKGRALLKVELVKWDATKLPLADSSVDVFVTDLPFGKRSGSKLRNWHLYPRLLVEMARVAKHNSGRVCLLTQDKKCMIKTLMTVSAYWRRSNTLWINIGGLAAGVYMLHRTNKAYDSNTTKKILQKCNQ